MSESKTKKNSIKFKIESQLAVILPKLIYLNLKPNKKQQQKLNKEFYQNR